MSKLLKRLKLIDDFVASYIKSKTISLKQYTLQYEQQRYWQGYMDGSRHTVSEYQTHIYKQNHPRLAPKEIWGVCIAYQGKGVVGDIAGSEEEANTKLEYWLNYLKENNNNE